MSDHLKKIFTDCEIVPPAGVWDKIAGQIPVAEDTNFLRKKMTAFAESPDPSAWMKIKDRLQAENRIAGKRSFRQPAYRMMTAAAFTGLLVLGGYFLLSKSNHKKQLAHHFPGTTNLKSQEALAVTAAVPAETTIRPAAMATSLPTMMQPEKQKKNRRPQATRLLRNTIITLAGFPENEKEVAVPARLIRNEAGDVIQDTRILATASDPYIKITGPNGQQTKISAKFRNLLLYMNRDNDMADNYQYADKSFMESLVWQTRFRNWRNKILENGVIPSSTNFMDIVELKDLILKDKENK